METNSLSLWQDNLPNFTKEIHKYDRGHALIFGGGIECTGAAKLAATAALRTGAGLSTIISPETALPVYAPALFSVMAKPYKNKTDIKRYFSSKHNQAIVIGPGNGVSKTTKSNTLLCLSMQKKCVIDADAITVFEDNPKELFNAIKSPVVLTPHEGEFKKLFKLNLSREESALVSAKKSGAVIVLKGRKTIIASPDGRTVINNNAPQYLATAGSGDVLSGIICGLIAQGMEIFSASCAGVWIHSECANIFGRGLISQDIPDIIPRVLNRILP